MYTTASNPPVDNMLNKGLDTLDILKLKGLTHTSVVYSNTNPYAHVAMMGQMVARSNEAGRYFRCSDTFISVVYGPTVKQININSDPNQIDVNFEEDWKEHLITTGLPACDLKYKDSRTLRENTMRFLNAHDRRIPAARPRRVLESRELDVPPEYKSEYDELVALIKAGKDFTQYLSRDISKKKRSDKNDGLLNSWGIHHLHLNVKGSKKLVFCVITEVELFVIQLLAHNAEHLWTDTQLVQILHDNWPEIIVHAKRTNLLPEVVTPEKHSYIRRNNANTLITLADGTVYLPLAGGITASGHSLEDVSSCRQIFLDLKFLQDLTIKSVLEIRSLLNMPASQKLVVRMAFDNRRCCFYEPTQMVWLGGWGN